MRGIYRIAFMPLVRRTRPRTTPDKVSPPPPLRPFQGPIASCPWCSGRVPHRTHSEDVVMTASPPQSRRFSNVRGFSRAQRLRVGQGTPRGRSAAARRSRGRRHQGCAKGPAALLSHGSHAPLLQAVGEVAALRVHHRVSHGHVDTGTLLGTPPQPTHTQSTDIKRTTCTQTCKRARTSC
jgi:hypothetical protein